MDEGAFARAFRSELQPVEVASAVQREMDDRAAIVAKGRTLVPNDFVVELAESDHERLDVYAESLGVELANLARDYAKEQGYSFVGPVRMRFEGIPDMTTGKNWKWLGFSQPLTRFTTTRAARRSWPLRLNPRS